MATALRCSRLLLHRALLQRGCNGGSSSSVWHHAGLAQTSASASATARHVCIAAAAAAAAASGTGGAVLQLKGLAGERIGMPEFDLLGSVTPLGTAARWISSSAAATAAAAASGGQPKQQQPKSSSGGGGAQQQKQPAARGAESSPAEGFDSLELTEEKINSITDKIPQRPVGVVEGTSYSLVIAAAFGCLAYFVYNFLVTLVLEPVQQQCFNAALERLRADPRITVRLGPSIVGYGQETANRSARSVIPHQLYKDAEGREHVRLQFHMRGAGGTALVSADMYRGGGSSSSSSDSSQQQQWEYSYLVADVATGGSPPQRLNIVMPR